MRERSTPYQPSLPKHHAGPDNNMAINSPATMQTSALTLANGLRSLGANQYSFQRSLIQWVCCAMVEVNVALPVVSLPREAKKLSVSLRLKLQVRSERDRPLAI